MNLIQLHDFIKTNYEENLYQDQIEAYKNLQNDYHYSQDIHPNNKNDYQLGYDQAMSDYRRNHAFHNYPESLLKFGHKLTNDKLSEITLFVAGYRDACQNISTKL